MPGEQLITMLSTRQLHALAPSSPSPARASAVLRKSPSTQPKAPQPLTAQSHSLSPTALIELQPLQIFQLGFELFGGICV